MLKNILSKSLQTSRVFLKTPQFSVPSSRLLTFQSQRNFAINTSPKHEIELSGLLDSAQALFQEKKYSEAIKKYEECMTFIESQSNKKDYASLYITHLMSKAYYQNKDYDRAIFKAEQIIKVPDKDLSPSNLQYVAESYSTIAHSYLELGNLKKAEEYVRQCIKYKRLNSEHVLTLVSYYKFLANLYIKQKRYEEAIKLLEEYLAEFNATPGAFAEAFAEIYYMMAGISENLRKLDRAISLYENSLRQGLFKDKPEERLLVESKIASIYVEKKEKDKALKLATELLEKLKEVADKEISKITLANVVKIFDDLQENPLVLSLLRSWIESTKSESLLSSEIVKRIIKMVDEKYETSDSKDYIKNLKGLISARASPSNLDMAEITAYSAKLERRSNNIEDAITLTLEAIQLIKATKKIPQLVPNLLIELAELYHQKKFYDMALDSMYESIGVLNKFFAKNHPDAISIYTQAGNLLRNLGGKEESREYYEKALLYAIDSLGQGHKVTGFAYLNFGLSLVDSNLVNDGYEFLQNGLKTLQKAVDKESREYCDGLDIAIRGYSQGKDYKEAIKLGKERLRLAKTLFGENNSRYLNALIETGTHSTDNNQPDDALNYLQDALTVSKALNENSSPIMKKLNIEVQRALSKKKELSM